MTATVDPRSIQASAPALDSLLREALAGLAATPKTLPCKLLYDERGSALFDRICDLPEYYPTRTETAILRDRAGDIAGRIPPGAALIELGSGSSVKTRLLLDHAPQLSAYVPMDISREHLHASAERLRRDYPLLNVQPVCGDYCNGIELPDTLADDIPRIVFFPGSTIGNFHPQEAVAFLASLASLAGPGGSGGSGGSLIIGVDLRKPADVLLPAYDDAEGVTAAFNLNLLHRLNREWGADFDPDAFAHLALWDDRRGRMEMHLVSAAEQRVHLAGQTFHFDPGETIHTECSYKHTLPGFARLAAAAGWRVADVWTDDREWFSVQRLVRG